MIYLDEHPVPNDLNVIREMVIDSCVEVWINYHGEEYCLTHYGGNSPLIVDFSLEEGTEFKDFDEMLKAPIFEGKCLPEIIDEIDVTY